MDVTHLVSAAGRVTAPPPVHVLGRLAREPLVHFLVAGAAIVAVHARVAPAPPREIVVTAAVVRALRAEQRGRDGVPQTPAEEAAMLQRFVDNEVLYREALARGLDRGDLIVRRRLIQKMAFVSEGLEPVPEPTDAELESYLAAHAERWAVADRVSLTQVFASADRHGAHLDAVAAALRERLAAGADPTTLGDPFLHGRELRLRSERELAALFGPTFAARAVALAEGAWSEPLRSSYGLHLVRVTARRPGGLPRLAEVREAVARDWREERRAAADRAALDRLRRRYVVRVEAAP